MRRFLLAFLVIVSSYNLTLSQVNYSFDHIGADHGLSNLVVTSICQDSKGFMWFGTFNGLNRYDGYEMKTYFNNPKDSLSVSDDRITCIYEDYQKNLWVGTNVGGLNLYDREGDKFIRFYKGANIGSRITGNRVESIFQDSQGNLWVGTNEGLNLYDYKKHSFQFFYKDDADPSSINSNQVYSVVENSNKELLVLTNESELNLFSEKPRGFHRMQIDHSPTIKTARLIYPAEDHVLWLGTFDEGLIKITKKAVQQYRNIPGDEHSLSHNLIKSIVQDNNGKIWVGTDGGGLNIYNSETNDFTQIKADEENKSSLSSNAVYSLYKDRSGTIWIGTFGGGINSYNPDKVKFKTYTAIPNRLNTLSHKSVLAMKEDSKGNIWIGTDGGGLNMFDRTTNTFKHFMHNGKDPSSISSNVVKSIYEDHLGNLWIGTYLGGLNLYDRAKNRFTQIKPAVNDGPQSISIIWSIFEDSRNNLWLSTLGYGLCIYNRDNGTFNHFQPFAGDGALGDYNIISMLEDSQGNLWIGTEDHGVNLYNYKTGTFTYIHHDPADENSLSSDHAWVLFEDSGANIWIGTAGGGLDRYNKQTKNFEHFTTENGLPSNIINNILEDRQGNLWITTGKGLAKFTYDKKTVKNYTSKDGLQSNDFNNNSAFISRNGELFFGGLNGFNVFNPDRIKENPILPPVVITDFLLFNKPVKIGETGSALRKQITETESLTLSHEQSVMSFKFAALNYISSDKNQYAYKMEGFDNDWNDVTTRREVTYTNLDPGIYTFRVKASNNDGVWNNEGVSLKITITPPWWETLWFRLSILAMAIGTIGIIYKVRTQNIRKTLHHEKEVQLREERLMHEKEVVEISKNALEAEVNFKNSELATSVMNVVKQNEILLKIKDDITEANREEKHEELSRHLRRIIRTIDGELKPDQNWNQFEQLFNQLHENFLQRLKEKFPDLTSRDLKLCAYLRMNLNSKEIAPLISLSVRGVEDLRYRVRKKMGLDTNINLADYILSL